MNREIAKELRRQFSSSLMALHPMFREDATTNLPPGWRLFRYQYQESFTAFVILCISPKDDRFTVEVGWSRTGSLPKAKIFVLGESGDGELVRLSSLWHPQGDDHWWSVGKQRTLEEMVDFVPDQPVQEKLKCVEGCVSDAIAKIEEVGIPYLIQANKGLGFKGRD